ncbi:hypothetical protein SAMN05216410_3244 [Sanguibacter gelidistatuariae]|uniref:Uncharacterized protein n=1 Tax=Sanguibacter gelidistatuariae TaxID=1814289 RepID=A0A1G6UGW9_9MICO|nr:hypothetical protein [Sanguibacter gelidistatuariae]SDD39956.1 hypothetical protein SAMN05216410_3244 [Sanguibacter gelidistatuariae]
MTSPDLYVIIDRLTGGVVVPLGVWEDPEAAAEEIEDHYPEVTGQYAVRQLVDTAGLTDESFALAEHVPSEIPVSPISTVTGGTLLAGDLFAKVSGARCAQPVDGAPCGALILGDDVVQVLESGDVFVTAAAWAGWNADLCAAHSGM